MAELRPDGYSNEQCLACGETVRRPGVGPADRHRGDGGEFVTRKVLAAHAVLAGLSFYVVGLTVRLADFVDAGDHLAAFEPVHYVALGGMLYLLFVSLAWAMRNAIPEARS